MKKQLLTIIIFTTLIFGVSSDQRILGEWETVVYDEIVEMIFEEDVITVRVFGNEEALIEETAYFGMIENFVVIDDVLYSYMLYDNKLLLIGDSGMFLLTRKKQAPPFTQAMLIGKWSAKRETEEFEIIFKDNGTVTSTIYIKGEQEQVVTSSYELTERYIIMENVNYLFRTSSDGRKLLLLGENIIFRKQ